jgi:hypothetical protein
MGLSFLMAMDWADHSMMRDIQWGRPGRVQQPPTFVLAGLALTPASQKVACITLVSIYMMHII